MGADLQAHGGRWGAQGFWVLVVYRFGRWRYTVRPAWLRKVFSLIYHVLYKLVQILTGIELPCEVQYTKDGATQVLWRASTETGYCEDKAAQFAEKQRGWGWQCVATAGKAQKDTDDEPETEAQPQN